MKMKNAMLIDISRCIGCSACTVACRNEYDEASFGILRTRMKKQEAQYFPRASLRFRKVMCMHCQENAPCIGVCPVSAISYIAGENGGMVVIDQDTCVGCGLCVRTCPFGAPVMDQERRKAEKCTFCYTRVLAGEIPFCADACPVGAIVYGTRDQVVAEGEKRAQNLKERNRTAYIWGLEDTGVLYLLDWPPPLFQLPQEGFTRTAMSDLLQLASPLGSMTAVAALGTLGLKHLQTRKEQVKEKESK